MTYQAGLSGVSRFDGRAIDLLEQVLSLTGALPERELSLLRKLANRLRPALSGLSTARPTRRRNRRLDFARTLAANLDTAHLRSDGRIAIAPRRLIFRTPARRHMDWHLIFVVDVSGSMEASVIYSAFRLAPRRARVPRRRAASTRGAGTSGDRGGS